MSFNVLQPELVWLGNRCYRKIPIRQKLDVDEEDERPAIVSNPFEEDDYSHVPMKSTGVNEFQTSVNVPNIIFRTIERNQLMRIGRETKARLRPEKRIDCRELLISGENKKSVGSAYDRIMLIANSARLRLDFTHFVSVPMNLPNLQKSFQMFKQEVLEKCSQASGLSEDIFQTPNKLHLTITTLALLDNRDREQSISILQGCKGTIKDLLHGEPLTLIVKGIEHMNDDPSEVDVLYAKINDHEDNNFLQIIADKVLEKFKEENLVVKQPSSTVKLHMTLMNTTYRNTLNNPNEERKRQTFDAREIFEQFSSYEFGVVEIPEIHLSIRHSKHDRTGYYKAATILKLT